MHLMCDYLSPGSFDQPGIEHAIEEFHHIPVTDLGFDVEVRRDVVTDLGDGMRRLQEIPDMGADALQPEVERPLHVQHGDLLVEDTRYLAGRFADDGRGLEHGGYLPASRMPRQPVIERVDGDQPVEQRAGASRAGQFLEIDEAGKSGIAGERR